MRVDIEAGAFGFRSQLF